MISDLGGNRNVTRRAIGVWWVALAAVAILSYALLSAEPNVLRRGVFAMVFQVACWTAALLLLAWRQPNGQLRLSDPCTLVLLWGLIYLIYPSVLSFQKGYVGTSAVFPLEMSILLYWLHGLFFLGFTIGYLTFCGSPVSVLAKIDTKNLPSGWLLFSLSLLPLLIGVVTRLMSGGSLLPETTYGQETLSSYNNLLAARSAGGISYLWLQIYSKITFYFVLMQGIGAGLILIRTIRTRSGQLPTYLILAGIFVLSLFIGSGRRTEVYLTVLIALIFLDMVIGPLPWRKLLPIALAGFIVFVFFGYFRNSRGVEINTAIQEAYQTLVSEDPDSTMGEFTLMFTKELYAITIFRSIGGEGISYLVNSILFILPSQINPAKLEFVPTNSILSIAMIGRAAYEQGIGTAGAMIGDGYRFFGVIGVFIWAFILGSAIGLTQRWLSAQVQPGVQGPVLLKAALLAGLYGWTYNIFRTDIAEMNYIFIYDLLIPWLLLWFILLFFKESVWMKPLPVEKQP